MAGSPHLLMLLRHAIAEEQSATGRDDDRRLTGEGKRKLREVVAGMALTCLRSAPQGRGGTHAHE